MYYCRKKYSKKALLSGLIYIFCLFTTTAFAGRAPFYDYGNVIHSETIMKTVEVMVTKEECVAVASRILYPAPNHLRYMNMIGRPPNVEETYVVDVKAGPPPPTPGAVVVRRVEQGVDRVVNKVKDLVFDSDIYPHPKPLKVAPPQAVIANDVVCREISKPEKVQQFDGYKVTYVYNGQTYVIRTAERPGKQIQVKVTTQVTPMVN